MRLAAIFLICLLLAGCASPDGGDATADDARSTLTPTGLPLVNATQEQSVPAPVTAGCDVVRSNVGTPVGLGVYADRALADTGCFFDDLFPDHAWARSALVEVEWTPQAGMTGADAWFESDECVVSPTDPCDLPRATGSSAPLALKLEGTHFADHIDANLEVQVAAQGAAAQQPFTVHVTLFANATVDAGFTALA